MSQQLGRAHASPADPRTFKLSNFLKTSALPAVPASYQAGPLPETATWGMMANNSLGDCVFAACGHAIQTWTNNNGALMRPTDDGVIQTYSEVTGYQRGNPATDGGWYLSGQLQKWRSDGFVMSTGQVITVNADGTKSTRYVDTARNKIYAYMQIDPTNTAHLNASSYFLGGVYAGVWLPNFIKGKTVWDQPPAKTKPADIVPGSWGGHCVWSHKYKPGWRTIVTWGKEVEVSDAFWNKYFDETWGIVTLDQCDNTTLKSPQGLDMNGLNQALTGL